MGPICALAQLFFEAMRILQVAPSYTPIVGGDAHLLRAVSERLVERGHDVTVLTFDARSYRDFRTRGAGLPPRELVNGVRVVRVGPDTRLTRAGNNGRPLAGASRRRADRGRADHDVRRNPPAREPPSRVVDPESRGLAGAMPVLRAPVRRKGGAGEGQPPRFGTADLNLRAASGSAAFVL